MTLTLIKNYVLPPLSLWTAPNPDRQTPDFRSLSVRFHLSRDFNLSRNSTVKGELLIGKKIAEIQKNKKSLKRPPSFVVL